MALISDVVTLGSCYVPVCVELDPPKNLEMELHEHLKFGTLEAPAKNIEK